MAKTFPLLAAAILPTIALSNEIAVSDVSLSQSESRLVTVSYKLGNKPAIVTVDFLTNGVSIGEENFSNVSGDVNCLVTETEDLRTIKWQPRNSWPGHTNGCFSAKVTAHPLEDPPDYMVVSLGDDTAPSIAYYVSTNAFPEGGLTNDIYRTSRLVMRRIRASGVRWQMGATVADFEQAGSTESPKEYETAHYVTLPDDYFIGIYPVTQEQYRRITGAGALGGEYTGYADSAIRPRCEVNYNSLRGSGTGTGHGSLTSGCAINKLRNLTGIDFDLPSDAEWEYACKAGTTWLLYTGESFTSANVNKLGWVHGNSMYSDIEKRQTHAVGQKLPNPWGLYDMIGNTLEWCRDKYTANLGTNEVVNPIGTTGSDRVLRGFRFDRSWNKDGAHATTTYRAHYKENLGSGNETCGFRVVCPVVLKYSAE